MHIHLLSLNGNLLSSLSSSFPRFLSYVSFNRSISVWWMLFHYKMDSLFYHHRWCHRYSSFFIISLFSARSPKTDDDSNEDGEMREKYYVQLLMTIKKILLCVLMYKKKKMKIENNFLRHLSHSNSYAMSIKKLCAWNLKRIWWQWHKKNIADLKKPRSHLAPILFIFNLGVHST